MKALPKLIEQLHRAPQNVRYEDLYRLCVHLFGEPRQQGSSHAVFKTPWPGDPRVNIQNDKGRAKIYQVRQELTAIEKLKSHPSVPLSPEKPHEE